jgi:two-component system cell cycle sensor histidine kinase/response regulator CckA
MILRPREKAGEAAAMLEALASPAALATIDGAIIAANEAWRREGLARRRVPADWDLFAAFNAARAGGRGEGRVSRGGGEWLATVASAGAAGFLVRLDRGEPTASPAQGLGAFALALPFGAAIIAGEDPMAGEIVEANAALTRIAGAGRGARFGELLTERSREEAAAQFAAGAREPVEVSLAAAPERAALLYLMPGDGGVLACLQDVSEQKQLQSRLAQRNRMESVGQLAGGVAHDFNNLLSAIRLRTDELLLRHSLGDPSYDSLSEIRETVERAAAVVRQLLTFSRKATLQREVLDLNEALADTAVLLRRLVREDVELIIDHGANLPAVRMDRSQLETAVINLVVNARDALKAKGGGVVRITTSRLNLAEAQTAGYHGAPAAALAVFEVSDDGPGIAPEALSKIFEPFFTTKAVGEGTGLGLATVYGVVKQADGWISAASELGEGASFRVFLPAHEPPLAFEPAAGPAATRLAPRDLSGVGRILFVEDEPLVRGIAARLLRARGYEVIEAGDGLEALELVKANAGTIDLVISDVIMPGMDGPTLLKEARPWLGPAPVMFISGYAEAEFSRVLEGEVGVSFLPKPLDIKTLAERIKAELRPSGKAA